MLCGAPNGSTYHADEGKDVDYQTGVEWQADGVHEEQFKPATDFHDAWYHAIEHCGNEHHAQAQCKERTFEVGVGILLVVVHQHDSGQAKEVEQVDTDGESCEVKNEDEPAVGVWRIGIVFPLENQPEHQGSEHGRVSIYFAFYSREPESVAPSVSQSTSHTTGNNRNSLRQIFYHTLSADEFACQVGDTPKEEQDAECRECGTHHIDPICHLLRARGKEGEKLAGEHEERCTRWVSHFKAIGSSDELGAVPERSRGLYGRDVGKGCDEKYEPTCDVVDKFELFHCGTDVVTPVANRDYSRRKGSDALRVAAFAYVAVGGCDTLEY